MLRLRGAIGPAYKFDSRIQRFIRAHPFWRSDWVQEKFPHYTLEHIEHEQELAYASWVRHRMLTTLKIETKSTMHTGNMSTPHRRHYPRFAPIPIVAVNGDRYRNGRERLPTVIGGR